MRGHRRAVLVGALAGAVALAAGVARAEPGDDLTISVLTFGPHEHPFLKFGHNAILVQPRGQRGLAFNFGTFGFDSPGLMLTFLRGRMTYWLSVSEAEAAIASYRNDNRSVEMQELDLLPAERALLFRRLIENARPANRHYLYDYFWDNCSTRVRDAVDGVVGGAVGRAGAGPGTMSMRDHALRLVADLWWEYLGLHFGMGSHTDGPQTRWQEAFLPEKLRDLLREVRVERDGVLRPLVKSERVLFAARRSPPLARAPRVTPWFALIGVAAGGAFALVGWQGPRRRGARVALGAGTSVLGGLLGLLGLVLLALWTATNHRVAHANANILQCAPWAVALIVLGVGVARGRERAVHRAFRVVLAAGVLSAAGVAVKLLPGPAQDNFAFIALLLPMWIGWAWALRHLGQNLRQAQRSEARRVAA